MLFTVAFAVVALGVGLVGGLINGLLISRAGLTPIIATLGTSLAFTGLGVVLTNGSAVKLGYIEPFDNFGNSALFGVPICFAVFIAIAGTIGGVLRFSPFGLRLYLLGSNPKAARYAGFAPRRLLLVTYTVCGLLASEDLIAKKVDAIAVVPFDPPMLEGTLKRAMDRGIRVMTHEADNLKNTQVDMEAFDNADFGAHFNDQLAKCMG